MVIDAHLHLWDTERLHYGWLQRPENAAINRTYRFEDFRSLAAQAGVDRRTCGAWWSSRSSCSGQTG